MTTKNTRTLNDEASSWAARSVSGDFSEDDKRALNAWRQQSPEHQAAFETYEEILSLGADAGELAEAQALEEELEAFAAREYQKQRKVPLFSAIAASFAVIAISAVIFLNDPLRTETYATVKGEQMELALADGSTVNLNTNSELHVEIGRAQRKAHLTRGEITFDIAKNPDKPFVIETPSAAVTVLGTSFNVRQSAQETVVSVLSGVVQVAALNDTSASSEPSTLIAGQQIVIKPDSSSPNVTAFDPTRVLAWQQGRALYDNDLLTDVVADLNRYFPNRIEIADPTLNDLTVSGGFDVDDPLVALEALSVALSLRIDRSNPKVVLLYRDD